MGGLAVEDAALARVEFQGVSKRFGAGLAVDAISFVAESGSLVALLGPSGCGKSTTLRLIAGLEDPDEGRILIDGRDVTRLSPAERGLSMVFQSYALFPHLSVAENIIFGLRVRRVNRKETQRRLKEAAGLLALDTLLDRKPSQLSGGQQQRVALGRAIVAGARVCLMDEPLSNLDAQLRQEMRREIRSLQQRLGMTMLYVTHDQVEAMTMADRVVLMRGGKIEQDATPAELYRSPVTTFAARFVGTPPMNLLPLAALRGAEQKLGLALPPIPAASDISIGVRPEDIRLAETGVEGTVVAGEFHGADALMEIACGSSTVVARLPGDSAVAAGAPVRFVFPVDKSVLFETSTGRRIDPVKSA